MLKNISCKEIENSIKKSDIYGKEKEGNHNR